MSESGVTGAVAAGRSAVLVQLAAVFPAHEAVAFAAEQERLTVSLFVSLPPASWDVALAEVERRADLFADMRAASPLPGRHPMLSALESVVADAVRGCFG